MKTLRKHIKEAHPRKIKCEHCDNVFDAKYKLEIHITENHKLPTYKCDKCKKEFVTQWRLEKHKSIHDEKIRGSHYFNNRRVCPFEYFECKFAHKLSG